MTRTTIEPDEPCYSEEYEDEDLDCTWCGGEGMEENPDPLWYDGDYIPCTACAGTGKRSHQTVF